MWGKISIYASGAIIVLIWSIVMFPAPRLSAYLYEWGGPPPESNLAVVFEERAAESGNTTAQFNRATRLLQENPEHPEGLKLLLAASQDIPAAQNNLGAVRYKEGDYERAVQLWQKSGLPESSHNLGLAYFRGEGVEKDVQKARELLVGAKTTLGQRNLVALELAEYSEAEADLLGGILFNRGCLAETQGQTAQAIEYYRQAYNAGYVQAGYNLFLLQKNLPLLGQLVTQHDPKATIHVYRQTASKASQLVVMIEAAKWANEIRKIRSVLSELNNRYMRGRSTREKEQYKAAMVPLRRAIEELNYEYQAVLSKLPNREPAVLEAQDKELRELVTHLPPQWSDPINNLLQAAKSKDGVEASSRLRTTLSKLKEEQAKVKLVDSRPYYPAQLEMPATTGSIPGGASRWWDFATFKEGLGWPIPTAVTACWILVAWLLLRNTFEPRSSGK